MTAPRRVGVGLVPLRRAPSFDEMRATAHRARAEGFASVWVDAVFGWDALTVLTAVGLAVPDIELGTAVVPIYPRHPAVLAQQALTVDEVVGGRLALGVGTSHKVVVEHLFGYSFDRPGTHMAEQLSILLPLLREGRAEVDGATVRANIVWHDLPTSPMPVLLGALGPRMLDLAGSVADGAIVWLANDHALSTYVVRTLVAAADRAGRASPRVVCAMPVCTTDDVDARRASAAETFRLYGRLPSYRDMLDRSGARGPEEAAIIGGEAFVEDAVESLFDAGATDVLPVLFGEPDECERSWEVLATVARRGVAAVTNR